MVCCSVIILHAVHSQVIARKYESGAVGTLTHVVALQGTDYSCELEVFADGYQLKYEFF